MRRPEMLQPARRLARVRRRGAVQRVVTVNGIGARNWTHDATTEGIRKANDRSRSAATTIAGGVATKGSPAATLSLSDAGRARATAGDAVSIEHALVDATLAKHHNAAVVAVLRTAEEALDTLTKLGSR